jgi:hypothetical protein
MPSESGNKKEFVNVSGPESDALAKIQAEAFLDVLKVFPTFKKSFGWTEDHLKLATEAHVAKRLEEYEVLKAKDPFRMAVEVARKNSSTDTDQQNLAHWENFGERTRKALTERIQKEQFLANSQSSAEQPSTESVLENIRDDTTNFEIIVVQGKDGPRLRLVVMGGSGPSSASGGPSDEMLEGTLKDMGILPKQGKLRDLQDFPPTDPVNFEPGYLSHNQNAINLPADNIYPGATANVNLLYNNLSIYLPPAAVEQFISLPSSA